MSTKTEESNEKAGTALVGSASSLGNPVRGLINCSTVAAAATSKPEGSAVREDAEPSGKSQGEQVEKEKAITDLVSGYANPHEGWESLQVKKRLRGEYEKWIFGLSEWKSFVTLTFRDEKTPDVANSLFKWFVRKNNEHAFGKHYTQKVGHSYFSYVVGMEKQTRDVVHFHVLVDKPLDFSFVHKFWGKRCGYVWIDGSLESKAKAVNYVCKYCIKGGEIETFKQEKNIVPDEVPEWWKNETDISSRVGQGALPWTTCEALDDVNKK